MHWAAALAHLRGVAEVVSSGEDELTLRMCFTSRAVESPVEQLLTVAADRVRQRRWILFSAEVCALVEMSMQAALVHNATLGFGALAVQGGLYVLRGALPLSALSHSDLEQSARLIAHEAARLRVVQLPVTASPALAAYSAYSE